ncbi:hypothetical protein LCGC14_0387150 [marine sediment metagenome]|uniref:VRR-NUC domain-containing protein n=1 Tax=marine sediment metagenome TaxID=412755 RepID=A0A0F9TIX3_9ZZZZ
MRQAARVDDNQADIVQALEAAGATVLHLHQLGKGAPDILVGFRKVNHLMEIKDGDKSPSRRVLTADELTWHSNWRGDVLIVTSADDALRKIGATE